MYGENPKIEYFKYTWPNPRGYSLTHLTAAEAGRISYASTV